MNKCNTQCYLERYSGYPLRMMHLWTSCHVETRQDKVYHYSINLEVLRALIDFRHPLTLEEEPAELLEALSIIANRMNDGQGGS